METQILPAEEVTMVGDTTGDMSVFAHASCGHCGHQHYMTVGSALLLRPNVVTFLYERGLDVLSKQVWELEFAVTDRHVTVQSTDPWRVALCIDRDGDELELVVNDDLAVVDQTLRES